MLADDRNHVGAKLTTLTLCALYRRTIKLTCSGCQHVRRFDAVALWWLFEQRGWNDRLPGAYEARTVAVDGKKERRKLFLVEDEAATVRLIFDLALRGLDGQPMGTRKIAEHLNANGYSLRGRPFHNSNIDGILTREHYAGTYLDRTADDQGVAPSDEEAIAVACPRIVASDLITQVAARRAKAAPRVTAPRVTNSPVLLTGLAQCGCDGCRAGLTIRTGKGGQYGYYTCNANPGTADHRRPGAAPQLCATLRLRGHRLQHRDRRLRYPRRP